MFRPQSHDGESNDDGENNAGVAIRNLLQTKRNREQSDENDCDRESSEVCAKKFASSAPTETPTAAATIRSSESVRIAPRVDCMTTNVAIAAQ